jgi:hypothetical protein
LHIVMNTATALSLLLCAATLALWAYSVANPSWQFGKATPAPAKYREFSLSHGHVAFSTIETFVPPPGVSYPIGAERDGWNAIGVRWRRERMTLNRPTDRTVVATLSRSSTFALWLGWPLLVSAVLPTRWWVRHRRATRDGRKGQCPSCGYDLRATPDRCPECGKAVS